MSPTESRRRRFVIGAIVAGVTGLVAAAALHAPIVQASTSPQSKPTVTFTKDVAPILQENCQVCHQPNSIGPMPLITYADAKSYAGDIKEKVSARLMPPWHIDKSKGIRDYKNDRGLTDAQVSPRLWAGIGQRRTPRPRREG
jgi:mono/diheme cytochrome c family protein